jgi:hypothetical protein
LAVQKFDFAVHLSVSTKKAPASLAMQGLCVKNFFKTIRQGD